MSTRTRIAPTQVITNGAMSGNITSLPTILQSISGVSYEISWSGTSPTGTLSVQISNSYSVNPNGSVNNAGTWTTVYLDEGGTPTMTIAISGNTGSAFIDPIETDGYAIRLIYTAASGSGTMQAYICGKVQ
jgi:hypothetical protein